MEVASEEDGNRRATAKVDRKVEVTILEGKEMNVGCNRIEDGKEMLVQKKQKNQEKELLYPRQTRSPLPCALTSLLIDGSLCKSHADELTFSPSRGTFSVF